jgi:WD40 repeat protein
LAVDLEILLTLLVTAALQIRLIDLHKGAVRPYSNHASNINAILPLSTAVFVSGGADGCVRLHDSRLHSSSNQAAGRNSLLGRSFSLSAWTVVLLVCLQDT